MPFYRYDSHDDVHFVDCGGSVDLQTGLERLSVLRRELDQRPARHGVHKLMLDFRDLVWRDQSAHQHLSEITRQRFGLNADNPHLRAAILNRRISGAVAANEHWFVEENDALRWLLDEPT